MGYKYLGYLPNFRALGCQERETVSNSKLRSNTVKIVKIWWKYEKWYMEVGMYDIKMISVNFSNTQMLNRG